MSSDDAGRQNEAPSPELPSLSVGFWDAFASGSLWTEPVLAVLSCSSIGAGHYLILATDGSSTTQDKQEERRLRSPQERSSELSALNKSSQETGQQERHYQHGRLLLRRRALPCRPELLVDRLVSLLVYTKCLIKGRITPVVTDLQLLPGRWSRPNAPFVAHALYAAEGGEKERTHVDSNGKRDARAYASAPCLPASKRPRNGKADSSSEGPTPAASPVYAHSRAGPVATAQRGVRTKVAELHLYSHHWEVLARISYKSDVKSFANAKGESSLFSVHLIDAQATEIRATFFGRAVQMWYPRLRVGGVYIFSSGTLQRANRLHGTLSHAVEIKFDAAARIEELPDDPLIPLQKFERIQIAHIASRPVGTIVDVLAFVVEAKEPQTIISRVKNEEVVRRELTLLDSSGAFTSLTLFGSQALQLSQSALINTPLVAIKGARVNEYAGRACLASTAQMQISWFAEQPSPIEGATSAVALLSQGPGGTLGVSDDQLEAERQWWHSTGTRLASTAIAKSSGTSGIQTLAEIVTEVGQLVEGEPGATKSFRAIASVVDVTGKKLVWLRKVQKELPSASTSGAYKCNKCRRAVKPEPRWMLSLKIVDFTQTLSCVALGDQGQAIMQVVGTTAEGLCKLEGGGVDTRGRTFADILEQLSFAEFELELTAKCEIYKGDKAVQLMVRSASWLAGQVWSHVALNADLAERLLSSLPMSG